MTRRFWGRFEGDVLAKLNDKAAGHIAECDARGAQHRGHWRDNPPEYQKRLATVRAGFAAEYAVAQYLGYDYDFRNSGHNNWDVSDWISVRCRHQEMSDILVTRDSDNQHPGPMVLVRVLQGPDAFLGPDVLYYNLRGWDYLENLNVDARWDGKPYTDGHGGRHYVTPADQLRHIRELDQLSQNRRAS